MATYNFPDTIIPSAFSFGIKYNTQVNTSVLSGAIQTVEIPGARWVANLSYSDLEAAEARELAAFLVKLRGMGGRFYLHDFAHETPRGVAGGAPKVNQNNATGTQVTTIGWPSETADLLLPGDYVEIDTAQGSELKMITNSVTSVGNNTTATIQFEPPLRNIAANGSFLTLTKPKVLMVLDDDENRWDTDNPGLLTNYSFGCMEAYT